MIKNIVDFFRSLPAKFCSECGEQIEEQHECYGSKCNHCLNPLKR